MGLLMLGITSGMVIDILVLLLILRMFEKRMRLIADMTEQIGAGLELFENNSEQLIKLQKELDELKKEKEDREKEK